MSLSWLIVSPVIHIQLVLCGGTGLPMQRFAILRSIELCFISSQWMLLAILGARWLTVDPLSAPVRLAGFATLGAIDYLLLSRLLNREGLAEVLGFVRGLRGERVWFGS